MSAMNNGASVLTSVRPPAWVLAFVVCLAVGCASTDSRPDRSGAATPAASVQQETFTTPEEASEALIRAAENGDMAAMEEIFGPDGTDLVITEDPVLDRNQAAEFASEARVKTEVVRDPDDPDFATLLVGADDWPLPIPIVNDGGAWRFDTEAGRQEILYRRIGKNELIAIEICRGFVEAQYEYAQQKHGDSRINQYAQNIVSNPEPGTGLPGRPRMERGRGPSERPLPASSRRATPSATRHTTATTSRS